jgi:hypothetical protein
VPNKANKARAATGRDKEVSSAEVEKYEVQKQVEL